MKSDFKKALKYADDMFSKFIRARDKQCVTCGKPSDDCSHLFRRTHYSTRWDVRNAYGQCRSCHYKHHKQSEYNLISYALKRLGQSDMDDLEQCSHRTSHFKAFELKLIGDKYKELIS